MKRTRKTRGIASPDEHIDTLGKLLTQLRTCLTEAAGKKGTWSDYLALQAGSDVFYRLTLENIGETVLTGIAVSDPDVDSTA